MRAQKHALLSMWMPFANLCVYTRAQKHALLSMWKPFANFSPLKVGGCIPPKPFPMSF